MLIKVTGNLFDFEHQAYAQGVTPLGIMNVGIAVEFKKRFPEMFRKYKQICQKGLLSTGNIQVYREGDQIIFNLVTQATIIQAEARYLDESVETMYTFSKQNGINDIAMPQIGCGIGHLTVSDLERALQPFINDTATNVTVYSLRS